MRDRRGGWIGGLVLIVLGLIFLANELWPGIFGGWMFLVGLGLVFLIAYALGRQYGFLIPGCILTGLGVGVALIETNTVTDPTGQGGAVVLGLGLAFLAIWVIDLLVSRTAGRWWPLIPGAILALVGVAILYQQEAWLQEIGRWWPLVFIVLGVWILVDRLLRRSS